MAVKTFQIHWPSNRDRVGGGGVVVELDKWSIICHVLSYQGLRFTFLKLVVLMLLFSQPDIFSNIGKMSYWVEPVLSSGQSVLLKDTTR